MEFIRQTPANILILDIKLPDSYVFSLFQSLQHLQLSTSTVILTSYDEDVFLAQALEHGAIGYLLKSETVKTIVEAIQKVAQSETLWTQYQLLRIQHWHKVAGNRWASLTKREQEVVAALVGFRSDAEIADHLCLSIHTIHNHINHILSKLAMIDRREVARWAIQYRLIEIDDLKVSNAN